MTEMYKLTAGNWRYQAITLVLKKHNNLKNHCFDTQKIELRQSPHKILESAGGYSTGEKLLLKVVLDIWNGTGNAKIRDVIEKLDARNFTNVLEGFKHLGQLKILCEEKFNNLVNETEASSPGKDLVEG